MAKSSPVTATLRPVTAMTGLIACLPLLPGYATVAFTFGVLATSLGLSTLEATLMAALLFRGVAQFVGTSMIVQGDPLGAVVATTSLVTMRFFLTSAALVPYVRQVAPWKLALLAPSVADQGVAVALLTLDGRQATAGFLAGIQLPGHLTWILGTLAGCLVGSAIPDTRALGLDFAMPSMLTAVTMLQMRSRPAVTAALTAAACTLLLGLLLPGRWNLMAAGIVGTTVGAWSER